jgi:multiple sugar transport system permease protein
VKEPGGGAERLLLLAPAALLLLAAVGLPLARVLFLAFTRTELAGEVRIVGNGFGNFNRLAHDSRGWTAVRNTALFTGVSVAAETILGTGIALVLHRNFRGRGAVRAVAILPWALPTAVMALAWGWIFNDSFGVANDILQRVGILSAPAAWLAKPASAMSAMILADVWKTTPFVAVIVLAGLQGIPGAVLEAARVDGLGPVQRFHRVVLPLLVPAIVVAVVFRAIQAYGAFDLVYVLTGGGPGGATETISLYAYNADFRYLDFGYGAAIAVSGSLLVIALGIAGGWVGRRAGLGR